MSTPSLSESPSTSRVHYQEPHLHNVPVRHTKTDFTTTFQKIVPLIFVFLLGLSIYTKYRMATVPQTPLPVTSSLPEHLEKKWEDLKEGVHITQHKLEDIAEKGKEKLGGAIDASQAKWEDIKELGKIIQEGQEKGKEIFEKGKQLLSEKTEAVKEKIDDTHFGDLKEVFHDTQNKLEDIAGKGEEKLKEKLGKVIDAGQSKLEDIKEMGKGKIQEKGKEIYEKGKQLFSEKTDALKEKIDTEYEAGKEKLKQAAKVGKEKAMETIEEGKERAGTILESLKDFPQAKYENLDTTMREARFSHEHVTDAHPPPVHHKSLTQSLKERIGAFMESGAVYTTIAPYDGECPILDPDTCPASTNTTYIMWC